MERGSLKGLILTLLYIASLVAADPLVIERLHSFRGPFASGRNAIYYWEHGGSTMITENYVRLTPSQPSKVGWIWNFQPVYLSAWEVIINFQVSGARLGADGFAFWYVAEAKKEGPVFGGQNQWKGLGVFFDTYDNDGARNNPYVSVFINDGTKTWDGGRDGSGYANDGCVSHFRNTKTAAKITYKDGYLEVGIDVGERGLFQSCARIPAQLPPAYYFGLTAATGAVHDSHDIYSFDTYNLGTRVFPQRPQVPQNPPEQIPPKVVEAAPEVAPVDPPQAAEVEQANQANQANQELQDLVKKQQEQEQTLKDQLQQLQEQVQQLKQQPTAQQAAQPVQPVQQVQQEAQQAVQPVQPAQQAQPGKDLELCNTLQATNDQVATVVAELSSIKQLVNGFVEETKRSLADLSTKLVALQKDTTNVVSSGAKKSDVDQNKIISEFEHKVNDIRTYITSENNKVKSELAARIDSKDSGSQLRDLISDLRQIKHTIETVKSTTVEAQGSSWKLWMIVIVAVIPLYLLHLYGIFNKRKPASLRL